MIDNLLFQLCDSVIKHIYKNISMHLQKSHQLTPEEYEPQYVPVQPKILSVKVRFDFSLKKSKTRKLSPLIAQQELVNSVYEIKIRQHFCFDGNDFQIDSKCYLKSFQNKGEGELDVFIVKKIAGALSGVIFKITIKFFLNSQNLMCLLLKKVGETFAFAENIK